MSDPTNDVPVDDVDVVGGEASLIRDQGETEEELETHEPAAFQASISSADWTVETLVSQMRKGRIDLNPRFQRRNAWLDPRKSGLIESVILGYPVPQLVLAEKKDQPGHFLVIDGKQRLLALRQFCFDDSEPSDVGFDPLTLRGLQILEDLNGDVWTDVQSKDGTLAAKFENSTIRTVLLTGWKSEDLLLSLFLRLNTGSVTLSPQELRQALHPGPFSNWLDDSSVESIALRQLLGSDQPDRRMVDAELLLRYLALQHSPFSYKGNLKRFLDDSAGEFNGSWSSWKPTLESGLADLEAAIGAMQSIFPPEGVCRKWSGSRWERALNRAVFDFMTTSLSKSEVRERAIDSGETVVAALKQLCETDASFESAISATTKTVSAFRTRTGTWAQALSEIVGVDVQTPPALQ